MLIDSHHHLWDPTRRTYPWLAGDEMAPIRKTYSLADLRAVTPADRTVLVQTVSTVEETEEFLETAAKGELIAGVVGWVDVTAPDIADRLAALRERPGGDRLVGIRHPAQDEPDPDWLTRPDVVRGIAAIAAAGLTYDILVRPPQHAATVRLADSVPGARLILDHAGKPAIAAGGFEPWSAFMDELSRRPNVFCKLSGLVTEADPQAWQVADLRPYADRVLEAFGADRVLFGSDWPVCELAASYGEVLDVTRALTEGLSPAERAEVFAGTARRVYPLPA